MGIMRNLATKSSKSWELQVFLTMIFLLASLSGVSSSAQKGLQQEQERREGFRKNYGKDWVIEFNRQKGNPNYMHGGSINLEIVGFATLSQDVQKSRISETLRGFLLENAEFFSISPDELGQPGVAFTQRTIQVEYQQYYKGLRVINSSIFIRCTKDPRIVNIKSNIFPEIDIPIIPAISRPEALVVLGGFSGTDNIKPSTLELVVLPFRNENRVVLTWSAFSDMSVFFIDANNGRLLKKVPRIIN